MNKQDLIKKIELSGLAVLSLFGVTNKVLPFNDRPFNIEQKIQAKSKTSSKISYYDKKKTLKKQVVKTSYYTNKKKASVKLVKYNKEGQVTYNKTSTYDKKGRLSKVVEKSAFDQYVTSYNKSRWMADIAKTTYYKNGVKSKLVITDEGYSVWDYNNEGKTVTTITFVKGKVQEGAIRVIEDYNENKLLETQQTSIYKDGHYRLSQLDLYKGGKLHSKTAYLTNKTVTKTYEGNILKEEMIEENNLVVINIYGFNKKLEKKIIESDKEIVTKYYDASGKVYHSSIEIK